MIAAIFSLSAAGMPAGTHARISQGRAPRPKRMPFRQSTGLPPFGLPGAGRRTRPAPPFARPP